MDPATMAAISTALGFAKSEFIDKPEENKKRRMESITARYSPWTGMRAKDVESTNALGTMASMGMQGAAMGQSLEQAKGDQALKSLIAQKLSSEIRTPEEKGVTPEAPAPEATTAATDEGSGDPMAAIMELLRNSRTSRGSFKA